MANTRVFYQGAWQDWDNGETPNATNYTTRANANTAFTLIRGQETVVVNYTNSNPNQFGGTMTVLLDGTGRLYLLCTFIAAATALMIYKHGGFGPGHALAVLTLLALAAGFLVMKISFLAKIAVPFQALCFSATLLFHMIPAVTDGLLRLPIGDPILTDPLDPLLKKFYLAFLVVFLVGYTLQFRWLRKQGSIPETPAG